MRPLPIPQAPSLIFFLSPLMGRVVPAGAHPSTTGAIQPPGAAHSPPPRWPEALGRTVRCQITGYPSFINQIKHEVKANRGSSGELKKLAQAVTLTAKGEAVSGGRPWTGRAEAARGAPEGISTRRDGGRCGPRERPPLGKQRESREKTERKPRENRRLRAQAAIDGGSQAERQTGAGSR